MARGPQSCPPGATASEEIESGVEVVPVARTPGDRLARSFRLRLTDAIRRAVQGIVLIDSWNGVDEANVLDPNLAGGFQALVAAAASALPAAEEFEAEREQLVRNEHVLDAMIGVARRWHASARPHEALVLARAAADWACHQTARLGSSELEDLVREVGRAQVTGRLRTVSTTPRASVLGPSRTVCHVLTRALPIGGHTNFALRWMRLDRASIHRVVLSDQGDVPYPAALDEAAIGLHRCESERLTDRIVEIHAAIDGCDFVVLHTHPYDVAAVAACASTDGPTVIFVNHGDHLFTLGGAASDVFASFRPVGAELAVARRGLQAEAVRLLPIPLLAELSMTREEARASLDLEPTAPALLVLSAGWKCSPLKGDSLFPVLQGVLDEVPQAQLLVVGPDPESPDWVRLSNRCRGQVRLMGPLADPTVPLAAADVYLDAFPFFSETSTLEAIVAGAAACSYQPRLDWRPLYFEDVEIELTVARNRQQCVQQIVRLMIDDEERVRVAAAQRAAALRHITPRWNAELEHCYSLARARRGRRELPAPSRVIPPVADGLLALHSAAGITRTWGALLDHHGLGRHSTVRAAGGLALAITDALQGGQSLGAEDLEVSDAVATVTEYVDADTPWMAELILSIASAYSVSGLVDLKSLAPGLEASLAAAGVPVELIPGADRGLTSWDHAKEAKEDGHPPRNEMALAIGALQQVRPTQIAAVIRQLARRFTWLVFAEALFMPAHLHRIAQPAPHWSRLFAYEGLYRIGAFTSPLGRQVSLYGQIPPAEAAWRYELHGERENDRWRQSIEALTAELNAARTQQHLIWLEYLRVSGADDQR